METEIFCCFLFLQKTGRTSLFRLFNERGLAVSEGPILRRDWHEVDENILPAQPELGVEIIGHLAVEAAFLLQRAAANQGKLDEDTVGRALDAEEMRIEDEVRGG